MLSDSDSDGGAGDDHQLTINEHFAKAYAHKKEREELSKLKDKYGSDAGSDGVYDSSDDSEEDETEDEDGEELTPAVDAAILRTLARIRRRDPGIYESGKGIFEEEEQKTKDAVPALTRSKTKDKTKPLLMRQHALQSAIDGGPSRSPSPGPNVPTHAEEQAALRRETVAAFHSTATRADKEDGKAGGDDGDDDLDGFLVPREMTRDEAEVEQEEYRTFLARAVGEDIGELVTVEERVGEDGGEEGKGAKGEERKEGGKVDEKKTKKKKRKKGEGERKESDHEFLMNYILNRGWIDKSARHVPTFSEITASKSSKKSAKTGDKAEGEGAGVEAGDGGQEAGGLLDDEEFEEVADTFESSYNFRFEEPNATVIPTHPRNIDSLVRREDSARKEARERKKQRKEEKLLKKREEVRRMRALKMKEVRQKLERIGKEGGKSVDDEAFAELDLEGDWDPEKHDQQMAGIYGDDEQLEEDADDVDVEKPTWDDDIDITDIVPPVTATESHVTSQSKKKKKKKKRDEEAMDLDGVDVDAMDADVEMPVVDEEEEWDGTEEMRKQKVDEYMDELYGLEFNDMVGDLPTRFKYTPVAGQTFGLTPAEILLATDAELNQYMGVKKYAPYRRTGAWDANRGERLHELKGKVRSRADELGGFGGLAGDRREDGEQRPAKKRKGKKERTKAKLKNGDADVADGGVVEKSLGEGDTDGRGDGGLAKKRRRQKKSGGEVES
ncbi:Krr1-domain-containing protein [Rickenella mellea]|uniref:Krr1-domain-containing protein n=1 Tax=Rickenella mellea TaxID=50990 RepID=A0A4Y7Q639_9AGAM|nr:Krr1-domain-containing protein [Rickenella mellea]